MAEHGSRRRLSARLLMLPLIACGGASVAFAQAAEPAGALDDATGAPDYAEIIVTATKRSQSLQDVPASISAFTGDVLASRHIDTFERLGFTTPNLSYAKNAGLVPNFSIRGVSADGVSPAMESTVALHVDGVYQPRVVFLDLALTDLQSVEILRGPQGTLYGRNANAGVINLVSRKPTDRFEASATASIGNYQSYGIRGYVSGPLADGVSARVSGLYDYRGGFGRNLLNGHRIDGHENWGIKAALRLQPTSRLTIDLSASRSVSDASTPLYMANPPREGEGLNYTRLLDLGFDGRYTLRPYKVYNNFDPEMHTRQTALTGIIDWAPNDDLTIKSITGYQKYHLDVYQDQDAMPTQWSNARPYTDSHTFSQEFNLAARIAGRADLVAGVYYLDDHMNGGTIVALPPGSPFGSDATAGLLLVNGIRQTSISKAGFVDLTLRVIDGFRLIGGIRRTSDKRRSVQVNETSRGADFDTPGTVIGGCGRNHAVPDLTFNSTTGKAGAQYDLTRDVMGYVSWQNGFKAGGFSASVCDNQFLPEKLRSWEIGIKGRYFANHLTLNLSAFDYRYTNMQLSRTFNPSPTVIVTIIDNAASARVRGGEVEAMWRTDVGLSGDLALGLVYGKYGALVARNGAVPGNPEIDLGGFRLPRAPVVTANGGLQYEMNIRPGTLTLRGEAAYTGNVYFTPFNETIAQQRGYVLVNALATLTPKDLPLTLQVFVRNLTNKAYFTGLYTSGLMMNGRGNYGEPRTFGAALSVKM